MHKTKVSPTHLDSMNDIQKLFLHVSIHDHQNKIAIHLNFDLRFAYLDLLLIANAS